eukprot:2540790-Rhodomonas_salina.2
MRVSLTCCQACQQRPVRDIARARKDSMEENHTRFRTAISHDEHPDSVRTSAHCQSRALSPSLRRGQLRKAVSRQQIKPTLTQHLRK